VHHDALAMMIIIVIQLWISGLQKKSKRVLQGARAGPAWLV
jgi:hypothetical protein